jgi:RimJ/RimL family protein N-acetyltransferase
LTLKLAEASDYNDVIRMAKAFHEASPYKGLSFDEDKCKELFQKYLLGDRRSLIIILAGNYGMIIGFCDSLPFSSDRVAVELAWWVDEDKRGSRDSLLLFKAYEDWALRVGAKIKQMAMLDDVTNLAAFYEKQGYRPAERSYIKETM